MMWSLRQSRDGSNYNTDDALHPRYRGAQDDPLVGLAAVGLGIVAVGPLAPALGRLALRLIPAAPAIPWLTSGDGSQMYRQAVGALRGMAPGQRAEAFRNFARQIEAATNGGWFARQLAAQNGTVFSGRAGESIVFDAAGMMFRGNIGNVDQFSRTAAGVVANYERLIPLR